MIAGVVFVSVTVSGAGPNVGPAVNEVCGLLCTMTVFVVDDELSVLVTVSLAMNVPGFVYVCNGCCSELFVPSPKSHRHLVAAGLPVLRSMKVTSNGADPESTPVVSNAAVGGPSTTMRLIKR
jgi:hypothetical protein